MAIAGSGGWPPCVRVSIHKRQLQRAQSSRHNVHPSQVFLPEQAAAHFVDNPRAFIYVPETQDGGYFYLYDLLLEMDLIDSWESHRRLYLV